MFVWSVLIQPLYLEGTCFVVRKNLQKLLFLLDLKGRSARLARWRTRLLELDLEALHRPGCHHQTPDEVSRLPKETEGEKETPIDYQVPLFDLKTGTVLPVMMVEHQLMPMPSMKALKDGQTVNSYCRDVRKMVGKDSRCMFNDIGLLCCKAVLDR